MKDIYPSSASWNIYFRVFVISLFLATCVRFFLSLTPQLCHFAVSFWGSSSHPCEIITHDCCAIVRHVDSGPWFSRGSSDRKSGIWWAQIHLQEKGLTFSQKGQLGISLEIPGSCWRDSLLSICRTLTGNPKNKFNMCAVTGLGLKLTVPSPKYATAFSS